MKVKEYYISQFWDVAKPLIQLTRKEGKLREIAKILNIDSSHPAYPVRQAFVATDRRNTSFDQLRNKKVQIYGWLLGYQQSHVYWIGNKIRACRNREISFQLYVNKKYRRNGIGTKLIDEARKYFKKRHPGMKIYVSVSDDNHAFFTKQSITARKEKDLNFQWQRFTLNEPIEI